MRAYVDHSILLRSDDWEPLSRRALVLGDFGLWAAPDILSGEARLAHPVPDDDAVEDLLRVLEMFRQPPAERSAARRMIVVGAEPKYSGTVELKEAEGHSDSESQLFRTLGTMTPNRFVNSPTTGIWRLLLADHAWTPKNRAGDSSEAIRASSGNPGDSRTYRSEERGESLELEPEVFEMECHP